MDNFIILIQHGFSFLSHKAFRNIDTGLKLFIQRNPKILERNHLVQQQILWAWWGPLQCKADGTKFKILSDDDSYRNRNRPFIFVLS